MQSEINLFRNRGRRRRKGGCGPSVCRLKLASSKPLQYERLLLPVRLMVDPWDRTTLFNCFSGCLISISNLIYLSPGFLECFCQQLSWALTIQKRVNTLVSEANLHFSSLLHSPHPISSCLAAQ